jgi:hypothetical protein
MAPDLERLARMPWPVASLASFCPVQRTCIAKPIGLLHLRAATLPLPPSACAILASNLLRICANHRSSDAAYLDQADMLHRELCKWRMASLWGKRVKQ